MKNIVDDCKGTLTCPYCGKISKEYTIRDLYSEEICSNCKKTYVVDICFLGRIIREKEKMHSKYCKKCKRETAHRDDECMNCREEFYTQ